MVLTLECSPAAMAQAGTESQSTVDSGQIADIVVTAQRREENVQKSSLSIEVLSKEDLAKSGVTSARDLGQLVPGLSVAQGGSYAQTFIRGVGDATTNDFSSSGVVYSENGVVINRNIALSPNFYDLERIEVLKGPQGTLYGRNSTGGAINLITRRPGYETGGYVTVEAGNYNSLKVNGALNVPVSDIFMLRGAFQIAKHDGYLSDGRNDQDQRAGRLTAMLEPSSDFSLLVVADVQHEGGKGPGGALLPLPAGASAWTGPSDTLSTSRLPSIAILPNANTAFINGNYASVSAEANLNVGFAKATLVAGHRYVDQHSSTAQPGFTTNYAGKSKQDSVEFRLSNQSNVLRWVAGLYYFHENIDSVLNPTISNVIPFLNASFDIPSLPTTSLGAFADATFSVSSSFRLLGGIRYTHDKKSILGMLNDFSIAHLPSVAISGSANYSRVTWKAGAEFDVGPQNMLYATVSTGYKAGGFSAVAPPNNQFRPESLTSYVFGSKNRFLGNRLQINAEAFYWKYNDYQTSVLQPQPNGIVSQPIINAGSAKIYGLDLDVTAKITKLDTIRFVGEYLHTQFGEFSYVRSATGLVPGVTTGCTFSGPAFTQFGNQVQTLDCSGFPLQRSPKFSGTVSYDHVFPLANGGDVDFRAFTTFAGSRWLGGEYVGAELARPFATVDVDLTYTSPDNGFTLSAYGRNVGNKPVYSNATIQPLSGGSALFTAINAPATYGVRASIKF
ncbi:TonB-dependent receptor [Novosphingobium pentaromativorans]|nr:TonB-dependent receptor [Novosphingobium pentaromativorans]AIT81840.1 hypothetical protein JI59_19810 [Novosphingobium pentaromativorans US6-1]